MYFVEREPGTVSVYESAGELAQAIREGALGPRARIFHRLSAQWLSITKHPFYRQADDETEGQSLEPLGPRHWTFFPSPVPHLKPAEPAASSARRSNRTSGESPEIPAAKTRWLRWPDSIREILTKISSMSPLGSSTD